MASYTQHRQRRQDDQPSSRDASEEDNDDSSLKAANSKPHHAGGGNPGMRQKKSDVVGGRGGHPERGTDSPYEGDVESSSTAHFPTSDSTATLSSSDTSSQTSLHAPTQPHSNLPINQPSTTISNPSRSRESSADVEASIPAASEIVELSVEDIRGFVQRALDGVDEPEGGVGKRNYQVNPPPTDRPVRIYADGVYDMFHFGHSLQMRQAKLCFPNVHLLIGVASDELCLAHKSLPALRHAERCESIKHCKWVDEVVPSCPWEITQEFIDEWEIDYVAHDEEAYVSAGKEDIYEFVKKQGRFLPTRRTPGISTSDLLERIIRGYRAGTFDAKLEKNGHPELSAKFVDWKRSSNDAVSGREHPGPAQD